MQRPGVGRRPAQGDEPRTEDQATRSAAPEQTVGFEGRDQPVGGGTGDAGSLDHQGDRGAPVRHRVDDRHRLVEHADPA
ncbi:MAG: hypothetical protein WKF43_13620 [Acidimicrobiales bacterium]